MTPAARATVTAAVYTHNSAGALLERVFESVTWADEILVVDMESTDGTRDIAKRYAHRIIVHNDHESINVNFNKGYDEATGEYVLHISHDFVVSPELREEFLGILSNPDRMDIYEVGQTVYFFGAPVELTIWERERYPLFFKKGTVRYPANRLEELPDRLSRRVARTTHRMLHYTVPTVSALVRKYNRYTDIEVRNSPEVFPVVRNPLYLAFSGIGCFAYNYLVRGGWRYGMHGLIVTYLQGVYYFLQRAKRWERDWKERKGGKWHDDLES